jgi:hypothetical protein
MWSARSAGRHCLIRDRLLLQPDLRSPPMRKKTTLADAELAALAAVDGTHARSRMRTAIRARLTELGLVERREWPNGPLWRTSAGDRLVRGGSKARAASMVGPTRHAAGHPR